MNIDILRQLYPEASPDTEIVWSGSWCDYEENAHFFIIRINGLLWIQDYQYSVYSDDNVMKWEPWFVTEAYALAYLLEREDTFEFD